MIQEAGYTKNTVVFFFPAHLIWCEVAWVLVFSGTQVQPQKILNSDYLSDYLSVSYDFDLDENTYVNSKEEKLLVIIIDINFFFW